MIAKIARAARKVGNIVLRLWIGKPTNPIEKILFDAGRNLALEIGGVR